MSAATVSPEQLLRSARTIAIVGMSATPHKAAHRVPAALVRAGWHVIPVNPNAERVLGIPTRARLDDVTEQVDIVDVFRPATDAPEIARQAVAIGAGGLWLQLGIVSDEARGIAEDAGMAYVEDTCIDVVRRTYGISPPPPAG